MNIALNIATAQTVDAQIEQQLRKLIESKELKEGARLPTIGELAHQWRVGRSSISKALARLAADNIIECKPKRGIFIKSLNVKSVIGLLIGPDLTDESSCFYRAILKHLRMKMAASQDSKWHLRIYDGLTKLRAPRDLQSIDAYEQFADDLRNYPFKGIIKISGGLDDRERHMVGHGIPLVCLGTDAKVSDLVLDHGDFMRGSLEFVSSAKVESIAFFRTFNSKDVSVDMDALKEWDGDVPVQIHQLYEENVAPDAYEAFCHDRTIEIIKRWSSSSGRTNWPDAILISDDVAAIGILRALAERGFSPRDTHAIVVLSNEGLTHHYDIPVARYEFSPALIAETLLELLKIRLYGGTPPALPVRIKGYLKPN